MREPNRSGVLTGLAELHFYRAEFNQAVSRFDQYLTTGPDPWIIYATIWRYLASRRMGIDGKIPLKQQAAHLDRSKWPYPVVAFYLGELSQDALFAAAQSDDPGIQRNQVCEANAYVGELDLARGHKDKAKAKAYLMKAMNICPPAFLEKELAKRELRRM